MITQRVQRLHAKLSSSSQRIIRDESEQKAFAKIMYQSATANRELPTILRCAEFLNDFAQNFPINIIKDELIIGSQRFTSPDWQSYFSEEELANFPRIGNIGHISVDYGRVLDLGINGLRDQIAQMAESDNKKAFVLSVEAFAVFIHRHGCEKFSIHAPETFHEALQLVWFTQIFLHAEGNSGAISFGRFDQYLGPFLEADLESKRITEEQAFELLCCFCIKCCEGDESQNLLLGGTENKLSILLLQVMKEIKIWQPSISVRIGSSTSEQFWNEALGLCSTETGMPSFFNEPVVTSSLQKLGIPQKRAEDWGIVGCYEASPQGDCYPLTVAGGFALPELLLKFLQNQDDFDSFDSFYAGFKAFTAKFYQEEILPGFAKRWQDLKKNSPSPFESICVTGCIESGLAAEEGGAKFNLFGVNILGLGTLVDSLLSIQKLIFEEKEFSLEELTQQLKENFPNRKMLLRCRNLPNKFGTDSPVSNSLAQDLSSYVANLVLAHPLSSGARPYPGFFWFGQDINWKVVASPDGRLAGDRVSYGCGPGVFLDKADVTSILNSTACVEHSLCACGDPLTISLNRKDIVGEYGTKRIRQLIENYFQEGGFHLQFNIVDANQLEQAKETPRENQGLIVRVSGYSATFVAIGKPWQDAIIERTKLGM